jgi:hypothetical protein
MLRPLCLGLLLLTAVPAANAQVGGIMKKTKDQVTKKPDSTKAAASAAKPKCDPSSIVITNDVVDRYLKALNVRESEMQKLAKQPGATGQYYSAVLHRQEVKKRKDDFDQQQGPDWDKYQEIQKRMARGDTAAATDHVALTQSLDPNNVQVPQLDWDAQQNANATMDSTMRTAGGFSPCDWFDLGERVPRVVYILAEDPKAKEFQGYATQKEAAAIQPKVPQLAPLLSINYISPERRKKQEEAAAKQAEAAAQPASSGNAQTDCMVKAQQDWSKKHQTELEAAAKAQDMNTVMKLNAELQNEIAKCSQ